MKSSSYSGAARPRKRTGADHFGLFTLFLLLAASLALYIRLMATGMLSNLYLIILMVVLIVLNAVSVIVQLPLRRNKAGKLIMGIVSLLLSGAMLYGVVAVNSVQSALSKIVGKMTETEITEVRVMNDNPATSMGDTRGYTFGYIADADTKNTQSILDEVHRVEHEDRLRAVGHGDGDLVAGTDAQHLQALGAALNLLHHPPVRRGPAHERKGDVVRIGVCNVLDGLKHRPLKILQVHRHVAHIVLPGCFDFTHSRLPP